MLKFAELGSVRLQMRGRTIPAECQRFEASIRAYADNKAGTIVNPAVRTSFVSVEEAYGFYGNPIRLLGAYAPAHEKVFFSKC